MAFTCVWAVALLSLTVSGCWKSPDYPNSAKSKKTDSETGRSQAGPSADRDTPPASTEGASGGTGGQSEAKNPESKTLSAEKIYRRVKPSLVLVVAQVGTGSQFGSGFLVEPGMIVTNRHVVSGAVRLRVEPLGRQDQSAASARQIATHPTADLALLRSKLSGRGLALGDFEQVQVGESVFVAGNPKGLEATFSRGIVSAVRSKGEASVLQITAPVSEGSSGGPVLNERGKVIGVVYAVRRGGQNLNFAVPVSYVRETLRSVEGR